MNHNPETNSSTAIPPTTVLGYLTRGGEPTRVRSIAAKTMVLVGMLDFLLAISLIALGLTDNLSRYGNFRYYIEAGNYLAALRNFISDESQFVIASAILLTYGVMSLVLAGPVKRGRRSSSLVTWWSLAPLAPLVLLSAGAAATGVVIYTVGFFGRPDLPLSALLAVCTAVAALYVLLLKDLMAYLRWIAINPATEKQPQRFLPNVSTNRPRDR
jgi:hypothetical protein